MQFIQDYRRRPLQDRRREAQRQFERGYLPVILDVRMRNVSMTKSKFTVPDTDAATMACLYALVRRYCDPTLLSEQAVYAVALTFAETPGRPQETMLPASAALATVHRAHRSADDNLYVVFTVENVFGGAPQ